MKTNNPERSIDLFDLDELQRAERGRDLDLMEEQGMGIMFPSGRKRREKKGGDSRQLELFPQEHIKPKHKE